MKPQENTALLSAVMADLRQGGTLEQQLPGYEERSSQMEMARLMTQAIEQKTHAVLEAPTGTGKSLAYLIPIVHSGKVAVISTANKALQEQLFYKDIPFIQQHIKQVEAALVKGVSNYVCLDRLAEEEHQFQFYLQDPQFQQLTEEMRIQGKGFDGDFESLSFSVEHGLRQRICGDSDLCAWRKCPLYSPCYIRQMRDRAEHAQIIVVNHTLLLLDALSQGSILPEHEVVVLDEAHHLEEEATQVFTISVRYTQIMSLLSLKLFRANTSEKLQQQVYQLADQTWECLSQVFEKREANKVLLIEPIEPGLQLASTLETLAQELLLNPPAFETEKEESLYAKLMTRTGNLATSTRTVFEVGEHDRYVYYVERASLDGKDLSSLEAKASPLDVSAGLERALFGTWTTLCTSATLATVGTDRTQDATFDYFRKRVGLADTTVIESILPHTFDYQSHARLYVPRLQHMPAPVYGVSPEAEEYTRQIALHMYYLMRASRGRAFLLFSSRRMLDAVYEKVAPHLEYLLLRQGDMPRGELVRQFKEGNAVLFGLKSFWEGVDIPGEALSLVIIDKLPFDPPDDPVHEARVARMKAAGEDWFGIYVLPQAVLRLKQGMGRLIRTKEDCGVIALLDSRMFSKSYGRRVFAALPPAQRTSSLKEVQQFFASL
ncbi:MAG TPA: helicase C-terminal domain-containing protein [Ktedonosporobacter sp.]|nr:helicase C-terminal domain-containing protein [Ktedonosporobacter sp.]